MECSWETRVVKNLERVIKPHFCTVAQWHCTAEAARQWWPLKWYWPTNPWTGRKLTVRTRILLKIKSQLTQCSRLSPRKLLVEVIGYNNTVKKIQNLNLRDLFYIYTHIHLILTIMLWNSTTRQEKLSNSLPIIHNWKTAWARSQAQAT